MVDLNLWRLEYGGTEDDPSTVLEFGTHDTGYPFTRQVVIGPPRVETADTDHPLSPGTVFGPDLARGRTLQFAGAHLDGSTADDDNGWGRRLDEGAELEAIWKAREVSTVAGAVAKLTHVERARSVYGRPRRYTPTLDRVRFGWSEWSAEFDTVDDKFYGSVQRGAALDMHGPATSDVLPTFGSAPGPVRVEFQVLNDQPLTNPVLTASDADDVPLWTVGYSGTLVFTNDVAAWDYRVVLDLRPWELSTTLYRTLGANAAVQVPGRYVGSRAQTVGVPPTGGVRFSLTASTGAPSSAGKHTCAVTWLDAYEGL